MVPLAAARVKHRTAGPLVGAWKGRERGVRAGERPGTGTRLSYVAVTKKA